MLKLSSPVSGVYITREALPSWLRIIGEYFPQTYTIEAIRRVLIYRAKMGEVIPHLITLMIMSAVLVPLGVIAIKYSFYLAKKRATMY